MALQYTGSTALTITAANLASNAARSSAAVTTGTTNNTVNILVNVSVLTTAVGASGNKQVLVYGYESLDGTTYQGANGVVDNVDGTDKALTGVGNPSNLVLIGSINLNNGASANTINRTFDLLQAFGHIPVKWGIVLHNDAGTALGGTVTASYREVHYT